VDALSQIDTWDVPFAAAGVTGATSTIATRGDTQRSVLLASVSKPVAALATLVAAEEGVVDLDEPAGPAGSTVRHLLAHASGLPFDGSTPIAPPGRRRIYSNEGFALLGTHVSAAAEMPFSDYVHAAVCEPLGIFLDPRGHPGAGMHASVDDLLVLARELLVPRLVAVETHAEMVSVQFAGLGGVLPDFGRFSPLDWGLGVELKGGKAPHWSGSLTSAEAFGHFGGAGTFIWVDPLRRLGCVVLTTRPFGEWAKAVWPTLSDAVIRES
jgi:CubicO group peptidase (beta-lactamase class C family)